MCLPNCCKVSHSTPINVAYTDHPSNISFIALDFHPSATYSQILRKSTADPTVNAILHLTYNTIVTDADLTVNSSLTSGSNFDKPFDSFTA